MVSVGRANFLSNDLTTTIHDARHRATYHSRIRAHFQRTHIRSMRQTLRETNGRRVIG